MTEQELREQGPSVHYAAEYFTGDEDSALPDLTFAAPPGFEVVGFWCWRGGGHLCDEACKSDSVPMFAQAGWAAGVGRDISAVTA